MKKMTVKQLMEIINGKLVKGDQNLEIHHATPYLESIKEDNTLLFLLRKWRVKWELLKHFKQCIVVTDQISKELLEINECTIIQVEDDEVAYKQFIDYYRGQFHLPVIAVTGTSGKSTTVGLIYHVLSKSRKVTGTRNSANGRTSHFMYLMEIDDLTEAAVFETAVGKPGDILNACNYFKPQIGIITNIGIHHLDGCKSLEGYIKAKGEMITVLPNDGVLIVNADDELTSKLPFEQFKGKLIKVGIEKEAEVKATNVHYGDNGMVFTLQYKGETEEYYVPGFGVHQVYNALQAITALKELNIAYNQIKDALKTYKKLPLRLELNKGINQCTVINDTWNVTTTSLVSALKTLNDLALGKKKVVLLGEIHRTGEHTDLVVKQYVDLLNTYGRDVHTLITMGETGQRILNGLKESGFSGNLVHFSGIEGIYELLNQLLDHHSILLLKMTIEDHPDFINRILCK